VRSERGGGKGGEEPSRLGGKGRGRRPHHAARGTPAARQTNEARELTHSGDVIWRSKTIARKGNSVSRPSRAAAKRGAAANAYVIQKHAARRLHYDLRLELDGVMKSWAGQRAGQPSTPARKRLAVQVEDHPIE